MLERVSASSHPMVRQFLKDGAKGGEVPTINTPVGCPVCSHTGYHGRSGVYELLEVDDALRSPAQREWILRPCRLQPDAEESNQGVDAIGERHHSA